MRHLILLLLAGIVLTVSWESGGISPTQIQYATTPTSTWTLLGTAPAGDNTFKSTSNKLTRGRFYYFRARHVLDLGYTPWSDTVGVVWLTGGVPTGDTMLKGKDNAVIYIK